MNKSFEPDELMNSIRKRILVLAVALTCGNWFLFHANFGARSIFAPLKCKIDEARNGPNLAVPMP
jgi:hypothetical protein